MNTSRLLTAPDSVRRLLLILGGSIVFFEIAHIWFLNHAARLSPLTEALLGAIVLIVFIAPVLYFLILRPLTGLLAERVRREEELQSRSNELHALLRCSQSLSSTLDLDAVLQITTDSITELMDLPSAAIYLLKEDRLYLGATSPSLPPDFPEQLRCAQLADHPHIRKAIVSAQPVFVYDTHAAELTEAERAVSIQRGLRSILYLPLLVQEQVIGTLIVSKFGEPRLLSPSEIALCRTLASLAAMAVENARLYEQAQQEITERKQAEQRLAYEKERLTVTLRSIGDGVITTDTDGRIVMLNKAAESITGWSSEEAVGRPLLEVFPIINELTREACENPVEKVLATGSIIELANHTCLISKSGQEIVIEDSGAPIRDNESRIIGVVLVFRDMTEKQKLMESMQRAQKLESLGILAGGIAHDFNNLLAGIFGYLDMAKAQADAHAAEPIQRYLGKALGVFDRARALTQQLLTFSKGGSPVRTTIPLAPLIHHSANFALSGSNVNCRFDIAEDLWLCDGDENQLGQAIDNIVINAKQAMPSGGMITITARNVQDVAGHPGRFARISIGDEGIGMSKETLAKIFDPFFSTKSTGHGLGLATVFSIINRHDGWIEVESTPHVGTTFTMFIPASHREVYQSQRSEPVNYHGCGKILIMDDEEFIRETVGSMLQGMGFTIAPAKDGQEAFALFCDAERAGASFDASILDLTIPGGIGGKEIAQKMRGMNPNSIIIASSGYSEDPVIADPIGHGFNDKIIKPYRNDELMNLMMRNLKPTT